MDAGRSATLSSKPVRSLLPILLLVGCSFELPSAVRFDSGSATDSGSRDATPSADTGTPDLGATDLGSPDAGFADADPPDLGFDSGIDSGIDGGVDAGVDTGIDLGVPDLGVRDQGVVDTGYDSGFPDTGYDSGFPDTGYDAGTPDTGLRDSGFNAGFPFVVSNLDPNAFTYGPRLEIPVQGCDFDTSSGLFTPSNGGCPARQGVVATQFDQTQVMVLAADELVVRGVWTIHGARPLVLLIGGDAVIYTNAIVEASADPTSNLPGPGAPGTYCSVGAATINGNNSGGGGGGGFATNGARGGEGSINTRASGGMAFLSPILSPLSAGCPGGLGDGGAAGGAAGGAVQISVAEDLLVEGQLWANGSGGRGGGTNSSGGGGGGGSGGALLLEAAMIEIRSGAKLLAGGGGGGGGGGGAGGQDGEAGSSQDNVAAAGGVASNPAGRGGRSGRFTSDMMNLRPEDGRNSMGSSGAPGGGGGGSIGLIHLRAASCALNAGATFSGQTTGAGGCQIMPPP